MLSFYRLKNYHFKTLSNNNLPNVKFFMSKFHQIKKLLEDIINKSHFYKMTYILSNLALN